VLLIIDWPDYKTNTGIAKKLNITPVFDKMQDCRRNWMQYINSMPIKRLPKIIKNYRPKGRRNQGRPQTRLLCVCMRPEQVNKWPNLMRAR
jgi:hypothetical protein